MKEPLTILLIEDNPGDARIVQELLNEEKSILQECFFSHLNSLS